METTTHQEPTMTATTRAYGTHTSNPGKSYERTYPTAKLSDGRTIMLSRYGWAILEGDGQARSNEIRDEAWAIQQEWMAR
jgi:hypothetical protein